MIFKHLWQDPVRNTVLHIASELQNTKKSAAEIWFNNQPFNPLTLPSRNHALSFIFLLFLLSLTVVLSSCMLLFNSLICYPLHQTIARIFRLIFFTCCQSITVWIIMMVYLWYIFHFFFLFKMISLIWHVFSFFHFPHLKISYLSLAAMCPPSCPSPDWGLGPADRPTQLTDSSTRTGTTPGHKLLSLNAPLTSPTSFKSNSTQPIQFEPTTHIWNSIIQPSFDPVMLIDKNDMITWHTNSMSRSLRQQIFEILFWSDSTNVSKTIKSKVRHFN